MIFSTAGGNNFLLVQGGTSATADDSIINFGGLSDGSLAVGGSAAVISFSGQA